MKRYGTNYAPGASDAMFREPSLLMRPGQPIESTKTLSEVFPLRTFALCRNG